MKRSSLPKIRALDLRPEQSFINWNWPKPPAFTDDELSQVSDLIAVARLTRDIKRVPS